MNYPTYKVYEILYAKYLQRDPNELLSKAGFSLAGKSVADICGGGGRLSLAAQTQGANLIVYVEQERDMIPGILYSQQNIAVCNKTMENFVTYLNSFDAIFCQQGINYWINSVKLELLAERINNNGVLVFNTFYNKPSDFPTVRQYEFNGRKYVEVFYLLDGKVMHTQICEGIAPHFTSFDWVPEEEFVAKLNPWFDVIVEKERNTAFFVCKKRPSA